MIYPTDNPDVKFFVCQHELTPTTQKEHIQGYLRTYKTHKFDAFAIILGLKSGEYHFEKARGDDFENETYCTKLESRVIYSLPFEIGTPCSRSNRTKLKNIIDPLEGKNLYKYQKSIIDMIATPADPRKIYWYYDEVGNTGKSSLVKHLLLKHPTEICLIDGSAKDASYCLTEFINNSHNDIKVVLVDIPRSCYSNVSYDTLERIKNGMLFSAKYKSNYCLFNIPHIIVFCNYSPLDNQLSADRLQVIKCEL